MITLEEAEKNLKIDKRKFDWVCQTQAELFYVVANLCVKANAEYDVEKKNLAELDAQIGSLIRARNSTKKPTEKMIEESIVINPERKEQYNILLEKKHYADKLKALKEAYAQRASMIKELVNLLQMEYWQQNIGKPSKEVTEYNVQRARESRRRAKLE